MNTVICLVDHEKYETTNLCLILSASTSTLNNVQSLYISWSTYCQLSQHNPYRCWSVSEGFRVQVLTMSVPTHKVNGQTYCKGCTWTLSWGSVRELSWASWSHRCMQFIHWACVQYRWHCVSLEEKAHLGRPLVWGFGNTNNSLDIAIYLVINSTINNIYFNIENY